MSPAVLMLAAFIVSAAATMLSALAYKSWRKRDARRSPLSGKRYGHIPGQQLVNRSRDKQDDGIIGFMLAYFSLPLALLAWALARVPRDRLAWERGDWIIWLFGAALLFYSVRKMIGDFREVSRIEEGLLAERVTGMQLNRLVAHGCTVMHDLPCEVGNIDHLVIAPHAVFVVETKSFRKPTGRDDGHRVSYDGKGLTFPDFVNVDAVEQALANAQWVARYIRNTLGRDVPVIAALALPGWFIDRTEAGKTSLVRVFTPMGRGAEFMATGIERIGSEQRVLIAQSLATCYPVIQD